MAVSTRSRDLPTVGLFATLGMLAVCVLPAQALSLHPLLGPLDPEVPSDRSGEHQDAEETTG